MKPALIAVAALLLLPLAAVAEHRIPRVWANRLALPDYIAEPNRHTPRYTDGTYLPPLIGDTRRYTAADSPLIIGGPTVITPDASVTLAAGTLVVVDEYGTLENQGRLEINGTSADPVVFASNEVHPQNQTWGGLITAGNGYTYAEHLWIRDAAPSITCQPNSVVRLTNNRLEGGLIGIYQASQSCLITTSSIVAVRDGLVAAGVTPQISDTVIRAREHDIHRIIPSNEY